MAATDLNRMMTLPEAADYVALSTRTIRRQIKDGKLAAHKFGRVWRISEKDLQDFIHSHRAN